MREVVISKRDDLIDQIFPVINNESLVFLDKEYQEIIIIKDNKIDMILIDEFLKTEQKILIPETSQDNSFLSNLIDFYYQRLLHSDHEFKNRLFQIIEKIKIFQDDHIKVSQYYQSQDTRKILE